jgi:hypothetical protein
MDFGTQWPATARPALIWLDHAHALVARPHDGGTIVTAVDRSLDTEDRYLLRVMHEAVGSDRLFISGPDDLRLAFEREYVAIYQRPERLIDQGPEVEPGPRELGRRLRRLARGRSAAG